MTAATRRYIIVGLFTIFWAVLCSCSSEKKKNGADGSGGVGATELNSTGGESSVQECGNGIIEGDEQCDCGSDGICTPAELNGATCEQLENDSGLVKCDSNCNLDMSLCTKSSDGGGGPYGADSVVDAGHTGTCGPTKWNNPGNVPNPTVEKVAADSGRGFPFGKFDDIDMFGYVEEEFFISNTTPVPYTSRILVRRPKDPKKFSGTVFTEWLNVSGGIDFATEWTYSREYFMRAGHAHVSVSAQAVGANSLKTNCDPVRYASINHPGDGYAAAIFSQAGVAIRFQTDTILGSCLPVEAVIAIGQSQSAMALAMYINFNQSNDQVYDGIVPHSGMEPSNNFPPVPVFIVTTMSEGNMLLAPSQNLAKWVIAGATHADVFETSRGLEVADDIGLVVGTQNCVFPGNSFPTWRVLNAVWDWMHRWVRFGEKPPEAPLLGGPDEHGNLTGGVRLPEIDVPTATYTTGNSAADPMDFVSAMACVFMGATEAFSEEKLLELYPTHEDYVQKYTAAAEEALANGYILEEDCKVAIEAAKKAHVPN